MLKLIKYSERGQIEKYFSEVDFDHQTWILSDLRSKMELQKIIIKNKGFYIEDYVLRASDLWKLLFRKAFPDYEIISSDAALLYIKSFLEKNKEIVALSGFSAELLLDQLNRWNQIVFSDELIEQFHEYSQENDLFSDHMKREFILSQLIARLFITERKIISTWIPSLLQKVSRLSDFWDRPIWVDLRAEISLTECELFSQLSKNSNVIIFVPDSDFEIEYHSINKAYEYLKSQAMQVVGSSSSNLNSNDEKLKKSFFYSFHGPLAEVKFAVTLVRRWLSQGVSAAEITILSPDIESYWPALSEYMNYEGIPTQKSVSVRLATNPLVRAWVSYLHGIVDHRKYYDLEKAMYSRKSKVQTNFEEFRSQLYEIFSVHDIFRIPAAAESFDRQMDLGQMIDRDRFFEFCIKTWFEISPSSSEGLNQSLLKVLEKFLTESNSSIQVTVSDWLAFLEKIINQVEVTYLEKSSSGIQVSSLMSGWSFNSKYIIIMGISEENLSQIEKFGLSPQETRLIEKDLGLIFDSVEKKQKEYEFRWWFQDQNQEKHIFEPKTNWQGDLYNHSAFLVKFRGSHIREVSNSEFQSRWDYMQKKSYAQIFSSDICGRIQQDESGGVSSVGEGWYQKPLSPSAIENYLKCPFIFLSTRGFKLLDLDDVGIDVDSRSHGQFYHALVEEILKRENLYFDENEIYQLVEKSREEYLHLRSEDPTWPPRRKKYFEWILKFIEFEKKWRADFPATKTYGLEKKIEADLSLQEFKISFQGKIDRIDIQDDSSWVLIDYKSSTQRKTGAQTWLAKNDIQLLFYIWILKKLQMFPESAEFLGAFYLDLKTFSRKKGIQMNIPNQLLPELAKSNLYWTAETLNKNLEELEEKIIKVYQQIQSGEFAAVPQDIKDCQKCLWKKVCRAQHLN